MPKSKSKSSSKKAVSSSLKDSLKKMKEAKKQSTAPQKKTTKSKAPVSTKPESKVLTPDFHYRLKLYIGNKRDLKPVSKPVLKMILSMPKIPAQLMKVKIEEDRFMVDTREFSRKYFLEREYPEGVRVLADKDPKVVYDGGQLVIVLLLETPVPKEVDQKYFQLAKSKHESYSIKLGDAVQPKKKLVESLEAEEKKAQKKRKRKELEKEFQEKEMEKQERKKQKKRQRREKKKQTEE